MQRTIITVVAVLALSLVPVMAQAVVYWDDPMETFTVPSGSANSTGFESFAGSNGMTMDTATKYDGLGSLRYNFQAICQTTTGGQPCGGFIDRLFPATQDLWGRVHMRVSQDFQWGAPVGTTKLFSMRSTTGPQQWWFVFYFGLGVVLGAENTPATGSTTNYSANFTMPREQWHCIEWHTATNNPKGAANGTMEIWFDGVRTVSRNDISWVGATNPSTGWSYVRMYRQSGFGNLWFDRMAVGNTRIGCLGSTQDITAPASPLNFRVNP